jgi:hypothetical protein
MTQNRWSGKPGSVPDECGAWESKGGAMKAKKKQIIPSKPVITAPDIQHSDALVTTPAPSKPVFSAPSTQKSDALITTPGPSKVVLSVPEQDAKIFASDPDRPFKAYAHGVLFRMGELALGDIADAILVLAEIRQRFREANGTPIMDYASWQEFIGKPESPF